GPRSISATCGTVSVPDSAGTRPSGPSGLTTGSNSTSGRARASANSTSRPAPRSSVRRQRMRQHLAAWWIGAGLAVLTTAGGAMWAWAQTPAPAAGSNGKVAIVDVQRILARSVAGAAAREQLEKDKAAMQRQLDGQKTELEKMRDELEKKGQLLSADARREKQDAMERKVRDVRRHVDDLQAQLQKKEDALLQKVLQDVAGLIQRLGKDRGFAVVLERQRAGVLYNTNDTNLNNEELNAYDDQNKKATK